MTTPETPLDLAAIRADWQDWIDLRAAGITDSWHALRMVAALGERMVDALAAVTAERDHYLRAFRAQQEENQRVHANVREQYDVIEHAKKQRDEAVEQAKQAQATAAMRLGQLESARRDAEQVRAELTELKVQHAGNAAMAGFRVDIWTHPDVPTHQRIELKHDGCDAFCVSFQASPTPQVPMVELSAEVIRHLERAHGATPTAAPNADEQPGTWPECGRGVLGDWCRRPVNHVGDCSPKSRRLALPTVCPAEYTRPGGRQPGDRIVRCHLPYGHPGEHEEADTECTWLDAEPVAAGGEDGSGTADGGVSA